MQRPLIKFLCAVVSIFGLISCTQNKSTTELNDPWTMSRPQVQGKKGADTALRNFSDAAADPIAVDSDIVFRNKTGEDFSQMAIESTATCRSPSGESRQITQTRGLDHLPLLSLVPSQIWLSLDNTELQSASCSFHFQVTNSRGSTFSSDANNVHFSNLEAMETMQLKPNLAAPPGSDVNRTVDNVPTILAAKSATVEFNLAPETESTLILDQENKRDFNLLCEHFRNHRSRESQESAAQILNELINGAIDNDSVQTAPASVASHTQPDPRTSFTHQNCRIVEQSLNEQTGLSRVFMSRRFQLNYPRAGAITSSQLALEGVEPFQVHYGTRPFMTISIANPTTAPLAFRFPAARRHMIYLQPIVVHSNSTEVQREIGVDFSVSIAGAITQQVDGEDVVFVVSAGATATVSAIFNQHMTCSEFTGPGDIFGGFAYRTDVALSLRQFQNWDPQNVSLLGVVDDISPIPVATGFIVSSINEGWIQSSQYIQNYPERKQKLQGELNLRYLQGAATCILGEGLVPL